MGFLLTVDTSPSSCLSANSGIEPTYLICAADLCSPITSPQTNYTSSSMGQASYGFAQESRSSSSPHDRRRSSTSSDSSERAQKRASVRADSPACSVCDVADSRYMSSPQPQGYGQYYQPVSEYSSSEYWSSQGVEQYPPAVGGSDRSSLHHDGGGGIAGFNVGTGHGLPGPSGHQKKKSKPGAGRNLYGNLHVAGVRVPAMDGTMGLWFLFTVSHEHHHTSPTGC